MVCLQKDVCFEVGCIFRTQVTLTDVVACGKSDFEGILANIYDGLHFRQWNCEHYGRRTYRYITGHTHSNPSTHGVYIRSKSPCLTWQSSKRLITCICESDNILDSVWCYFQFCISHRKAIQYLESLTMGDTSVAEPRILETASDIQERRNQVLGR